MSVSLLSTIDDDDSWEFEDFVRAAVLALRLYGGFLLSIRRNSAMNNGDSVLNQREFSIAGVLKSPNSVTKSCSAFHLSGGTNPYVGIRFPDFAVINDESVVFF